MPACRSGELHLWPVDNVRIQTIPNQNAFSLEPGIHGKLLQLRGRLPVQPLPDVAEGEDDDTAEAKEPDVPPSQVYNDRSFMRASMPVQARKFMTDLESLYRRKGWPFVENGMVLVSRDKSESWSALLERIPGFFEQEFSKHQGYRFSKAVHAYLQTLIPQRDLAH